ncbi:MAG: 30S ribosomal protein S13 [Candidatus Spechtbacteria bacterium]|nr:30S ribosomal protein S13 [Candidatus Spechtbacteria bacterium]
MPRIAGVEIPENKRIEVSLTYIFGVGPTLSKKLLAQAKISPDRRAKELTAEEVNVLRNLMEVYKIEGDLRREISGNVKRLKDIGAYRGTRHAKGLPTRGQRTRTNSRTVRGNVRKTMGSGRKPSASPT